jgi:16S rRNA (guanine966-N2)-methyltransferase
VTRIVGGSASGRRLRVPAGRGTRPTSDRAREGMFSTIEALHGPLAGVRVLDLYAGSGALGLEALSRGAGHATLVESDGRAVRVLRANVTTLALPGADVRGEPVERVLQLPPTAPYDVVVADPPYTTDVGPVLALLVTNGWLAERAVVAVERSSRDPDLAWPEGIEPLRARRYGEATLWYGRRS